MRDGIASCRNAFPAPAGLNRVALPVNVLSTSVPRTRGAEPATALTRGGGQKRSPHPRG